MAKIAPRFLNALSTWFTFRFRLDFNFFCCVLCRCVNKSAEATPRGVGALLEATSNLAAMRHGMAPLCVAPLVDVRWAHVVGYK